MASIVDSDASQADDLHTDRTFDLASSGFGLHDEITQNQGQSRTKASSLTDEVVIGGRSRSQESTNDLWSNPTGYGNWIETNTSGWSESVSWNGRDWPSVTDLYPPGRRGMCRASR